MADSPLNLADAPASSPRIKPGDVPERLRRRYLTDAQNGPGLGFYVDARISTPAFRDHGGRLTTDRNDPHVVRDLVAIAQHRGWASVSVRGETAFRREFWIVGQAAGLEVRGYRPSERDLQDVARRAERTRSLTGASTRAERAAADTPDLRAPGPRRRLKIIEAVVKGRIADPADQARILAAARGRIAGWLERGANFEPAPNRNAPQRGRGR